MQKITNMKTGKLKLKALVILGKFSDGKVRQLLMNEQEKSAIENILSLKTGTILVLETPIEGIDITKGETITTE